MLIREVTDANFSVFDLADLISVEPPTFHTQCSTHLASWRQILGILSTNYLLVST